MSQMLQPVRGTHDFLFEDARKFDLVVQKTREIGLRFGFDEIQTPIFEFANVFDRTLGDTSDIVSKEMYTFTDKGGDALSLRPEGTAGVVRAFISNELKRQLPVKFFYQGPMFRYERPQKGRFRQFHQVGIELLGTESSQADIETVSYGEILLKELGVIEKCYLEINSIGDKSSRDQYRATLTDYYSKWQSGLSEDSQKRLATNPLRILDSKDRKDIEINSTAPKFSNSLNAESKEKFSKICEGLTALGVAYKVNDKLVRGLDYYTHLVFEFKTNALGAQDAVLSGGRYDGLVEVMGGDPTPGVGWAAGIERLSLLMETLPPKIRPASLIPMGDAAEQFCLILAHELRAQGLPVDVAYGGNMSNRMKKAARVGAKIAVIIGDQEMQSGELAIKNLDTGEQSKVSKTEIVSRIRELLG